jgi:hypothetical protein
MILVNNGIEDLGKAGHDEVVMHAKRGGVADRGTEPDDTGCHDR